MKGVLLKILSLFLCKFFTHCDSLSKFTDPGLFLDEDDDNPEELNAIIEHCGEEYREYRRLTIISAVSDKELSLQFYRQIHEKIAIPIEVFGDIKYLDSVGWQSCVILSLSNERLKKFFKIVHKYSWKPNNIYVIYTSGETSAEEEEEEEKVWSSSALELWKEKYVHKFILSRNGRNLFFDPFERSENFENTKDLSANGSKPRENFFGAVKHLENSFRLLERRDAFGGFGANVSLFAYVTVEKHDNGRRWSGADADSMYEICKRMKIIPRVFESPDQFGWFSEGKFFGTLGQLVYHQSDLAFNGFFVKYYGTRMLEFSSYVGWDRICVIVPKRARVPEYLLIVRIFSVQSWVLIYVGNCFVALTSAGMTDVDFGRRRVANKSKKSFENSSANVRSRMKRTRALEFFTKWIFLCFYPVEVKAVTLAQRLNTAFGLMLGIVIGGLFTSQLASSFSRPAFLKNIRTLAELDASGLEILTSFPNLLNDVFTDDSSTFRSLDVKLALKNASAIERQVLQLRNAGYLDRLQALQLAKHPNDEVHVVAEYPQEYPLAYPTIKGSPFLPRMNAIIGRLQSGGFYKKWVRDMVRPVENKQSQNPVVIRLPHLYIPFFILFVGLGIAGGIFCSEWYSRPLTISKTSRVQEQLNV